MLQAMRIASAGQALGTSRSHCCKGAFQNLQSARSQGRFDTIKFGASRAVLAPQGTRAGAVRWQLELQLELPASRKHNIRCAPSLDGLCCDAAWPFHARGAGPATLRKRTELHHTMGVRFTVNLGRQPLLHSARCQQPA